MRLLSDVLRGQGIDFTGWKLHSVDDISADGRTIVGLGTNPDGNIEVWIATIPEPSTALLLGMGLAVLAIRTRRTL